MDEESRYRPRQFEELVEDSDVSLLNEPMCAAVPLRPAQQRSLHAVLVEALIDVQALCARLEAGVHVQRDAQREAVRALYVASRNQAKALIACLELQGLE